MQYTYTTPQNNSSLLTHPWPEFARVGMLERWADELRQLVEQGSQKADWELVGRATMLIHDDAKALRQMLNRVSQVSGMELVEIEPDTLMQHVLDQEYLDTTRPFLVLVPQGLWSSTPGDGFDEDAIRLRAFQSQLPDYLAKLDSASVLVFVTFGENYGDLAPALRAKGAFDRRFVVPKLTTEEIGLQFMKEIGEAHCDESLLGNPGKVGILLEVELDDRRRQGLMAIAMQRLAYREHRLLNFKDLVHLMSYGGQETDPNPELSETLAHRVAIHEAGHVLVAMVDSNGANIPESATIIPSQQFRGVVNDSYSYHQSLEGRATYASTRHQIRINLAGRAAEEVVLGAEQVGTWSARSDLEEATRLARNLVGMCGFPANVEDAATLNGNLAVIKGEVSLPEEQHVIAQTRLLLNRQYDAVLDILRTNRELLDRITDQLLKERVLDHQNLTALWTEMRHVCITNEDANHIPIRGVAYKHDIVSPTT